MHGIRKVKTSEEKKQEKKLANKKKGKEYIALFEQLQQKRSSCEYDDELFRLTTDLLVRNPEQYVIWGVRRTTLLCLEITDNERHKERLEKELKFTVDSIAKVPKCYSVWFQRMWIVRFINGNKQNLPQFTLEIIDKVERTFEEKQSPNNGKEEQKLEMDWNKELALCDRMLKLDERNFHCWRYRKEITELAKISPTVSLDFTSSKIEKNFSNYSAWHYRSCYLKASVSSNEELLKKLRDEFVYVRNALYIEPEDQSGWVYHQWAISTAYSLAEELSGEREARKTIEEEIKVIDELLEIEPNCKWPLHERLICMVLISNPNAEIDKDSKERLNAIVNQLGKLDPLRKHYYEYLGQKIVCIS